MGIIDFIFISVWEEDSQCELKYILSLIQIALRLNHNNLIAT